MRGLLFSGAPNIMGVVLVLIFSLLFAVLVYAVYRRGARDEMQRAAQLPLDD